MRIQFLPDGSLFVLIVTNKVVIKKKKKESRKSKLAGHTSHFGSEIHVLVFYLTHHIRVNHYLRIN